MLGCWAFSVFKVIMPISTPPAITVSLPGAGTYEVQETSQSSLMVSGGSGDLINFANNAKLAVQSALPNVSTEMTGVENNGGELVGIFQIDGGNLKQVFQEPSSPSTTQSQLSGKPNWVAVLPLTISGGKPEWDNNGQWSQSWLVPTSLSGVPVIELAPDTQDIKSFQSTLSDLSSPQAAQAAGQIMTKYNVGAVVVAAYDEQSQQVSVWLYPGSQTTGNSASNIGDAHDAALSEINSLMPNTTEDNQSHTADSGGATQSSNAAPSSSLQNPTVSTAKPIAEPQAILSPGYQIDTN